MLGGGRQYFSVFFSVSQYFSVFSVFFNNFTSRSVQLGNNERVADDHEKTREEKEDDVDQAVVYLRREV